MSILAWNRCTTFAGIGAAVAYAFLFAVFGFHWQLVPGAVAGLAAAYLISTWLGEWVGRVEAGRYLTHSLIIGPGVALVTLLAGAVAIALTNFMIETARELVTAPAGQPFWNVLTEFAPGNAEDFVARPVLAAILFGLLPAMFLGEVYGFLLHARFDGSRVKVRSARNWAVGGALLILVVLASLVSAVLSGTLRTPGLPADLPIAINQCGERELSPGMLAFCRGHPCEQGQCQWDVVQDAFAVYVEPPAGSGWSWSGGGIGTARRPNEIGHGMYWVQREPNGFINETTPRRHVRYQLRFEGDYIQLGGQQFRFYPGVLLVIRYDEDWSFTAGVGREALQRTKVTAGQLQSAFDESCALNPACDTPFRIVVDPGQDASGPP